MQVANDVRLAPVVVGSHGEHLWDIAGFLLVGTKEDPAQLNLLNSQPAVDAFSESLSKPQKKRKDVSSTLADWKHVFTAPAPPQYVNWYRAAGSKYFFPGALTGWNMPAARTVMKMKAWDWDIPKTTSGNCRTQLGVLVSHMLHLERSYQVPNRSF